MAGSVAPNLVTDGLILYLDPASPKSYVSGAAVITDLSTSVNSTITGTYAIDTTTYGVPILSLNNTGSASNGQVQVVTQDLNALAVTQNFTVMFAARKNFYGVGPRRTEELVYVLDSGRPVWDVVCLSGMAGC